MSHRESALHAEEIFINPSVDPHEKSAEIVTDLGGLIAVEAIQIGLAATKLGSEKEEKLGLQS